MSLPDDFPSTDLLVANAVNYLIQGDELETSLLLLQCAARCLVSVYEKPMASRRGEVRVELTGPRKPYEAFTQEGARSDELWGAFNAVMPVGFTLTSLSTRVQIIDTINENWRLEMQVHLSGNNDTNQGVDIPNREVFLWRGLRLRSPAEVRIAAALEATGVMFLPNCLARLGSKDGDASQGGAMSGRQTREPDFLICAGGKWGVLEVDGSQHQGAAAKDHERDRLFQYHGIRVTLRYTAKECMNDAPSVVRDFLRLLALNG